MLLILAYALLSYLCVSMALYVWGHPQMFLKAKSNESILSLTTTTIGRQMAVGVQIANFAVHGILRRSHVQMPSGMKEIYAAATRRAFEKSKYFITTGSPHARALYLRNYAWFYPTLLDPRTFVGQHDAERRVTLIRRSLSIILRSTKYVPYSTTLIPISPRKFAAVNCIQQPSDSLLGVLSGIGQLTNAAVPDDGLYSDLLQRAASEGLALLDGHRDELRFQLDHLMDSLREFDWRGGKVPLIDRDGNRSTSTDTRLERRRFITNANVWTTFSRAIELGIAAQDEIEKRIARTLSTYKQELLELFGERGHIVDSLEAVQVEDYREVSLDFCHVHRGFWTFSSAREIELFRNTADIFLGHAELQDDSRRCFLVTAVNPRIQFFKQVAVASYHGRTMWPTFNVEFADRLLDLSIATNVSSYREAALAILMQLKTYIEKIGYYPELLRADGQPYQTWIYRGACADTWFPRFESVWARGAALGYYLQ